MTENKRFLIDDAGELIDFDNHKFIDYGDECCKLLNELHEENQLLHKINEDAIDFMYDNFDSNIIFHDRELNDICNEMGWELSEKGIKIKQLEKENEQLRKENDMLSCELSVSANKEISGNCRIAELEEENEQLKQQKARYKRLSEIRNEEINNRILTIKEFIDNCSNEKVKKALEDLFYSEVNEYDLSKKYRKLHDKYKKLQLENNGLKYALKYIKKIDVEIDVGDFND